MKITLVPPLPIFLAKFSKKKYKGGDQGKIFEILGAGPPHKNFWHCKENPRKLTFSTSENGMGGGQI